MNSKQIAHSRVKSGVRRTNKMKLKEDSATRPRITTPTDGPLTSPSTTPSSPTCVGDSALESRKIVESTSDSDEAPVRTSRRRLRSSTQRPLARLVSRESETSSGCPTPCISSGGEEDDDESALCDDCDGDHSMEEDRTEGVVATTPFQMAAAFCKPDVPPLPNPLHDARLLAAHERALRLEAELFPMRQILSRLMSHPIHNRRGIFNVPVDPVALGLPDYERVVPNPMDLGTVKARLHAVAYTRREEVGDDIRRVFHNAMTYNPHDNLVHISARELLALFEEHFLDVMIRAGEVAVPVVQAAPAKASLTTARPHALRSEIPTADSLSPRKRKHTDEAQFSSMTESAARKLVSSIISVQQVPRKRPRVHTTTEVVQPTSAVERAVASIISVLQVPSAAPLPVPVEPVQHTFHKFPKRRPVHMCGTCRGRTCVMCKEGCLSHEPALLICTGASCGSAKIRKGAVYYITPDGARQYCQRCYAGLQPILPHERDHGDSVQSPPIRYKRDLLKRKNDEDIVEQWLTCTECQISVHRICAMHNDFVHSKENYRCPSCVASLAPTQSRLTAPSTSNNETFTFVSGRDAPVPMSDFLGDHTYSESDVLSAEALAECPVSSFMQEKVRKRMASSGFLNVYRTVTVRMISECDKHFNVPDVVRKHFRMAAGSSESHLDARASPPSLVRYTSKAIALFQRIDGLDVCLFLMYVQEYDGEDDYDEDVDRAAVGQRKRVYIAYLDSVEYFRPRPCRTEVYHEMMVSYLATARARGYERAHIWACPPARGNSFVFWNHPNSQRTPTKDRLVAWYHGALSKAIDCGVVTDVKSLYENAFHDFLSQVKDEDPENMPTDSFAFDEARPGRMLCPPLLDGDFWIEESVRLHNATLSRYLKSKAGAKETACSQGDAGFSEHIESERCPAVQVASILRNRIMTHPSSEPFRKPVNASALNLKDYHRIISRPMDLGNIYSRCVLGEFESLADLVADVQLVFENAKRYNPKGHSIYKMACEMQALFFEELQSLTASWSCQDEFPQDSLPCQDQFADMSMSLDVRLDVNESDLSAKHLPAQSNTDTPSTIPPEVSVVPTVRAPNDTIRVRKSLVVKKLDLLTGGPEAVFQHMVGDDVWLLDKRNPMPPKKPGYIKKTVTGRRKAGRPQTEPVEELPQIPDDVPSNKRRRQSWLGEQVGLSMRRFRTSFFSCSLQPSSSPSEQQQSRLDDYEAYIDSFHSIQESTQDSGSPIIKSRIADARHALLEFSQFRNFEFDTLRRAKYSTAMLLYHLHNDSAPGMVPLCTSCGDHIQDVRWHKVVKPTTGRSAVAPELEELCTTCFEKHPNGKTFIPLPVSFKV